MSCRSLASSRLLRATASAVVSLLALAPSARACLWDWDTLQMERRRYPGALELITGKFVRHGADYYAWRIQDRIKRMRSPAEDPQLADDLAVAYAKLGRHAEALKLLEVVAAAHPDRYETLSNLGTIHMLAGDLQTGKQYIDRAIVINPDAHFGREKYQSLLAEYWLTKRKVPHEATDELFTMQLKPSDIGFAKFLLNKRDLVTSPDGLNDDVNAELSAAEKGVLGMMHFADYDSPLLLEALGDILISFPNRNADALHLAARAYYRIAQLSTNAETKSAFETVARKTVEGNQQYTRWVAQQRKNRAEGDAAPDVLHKLAAELATELASARDFAAAIEADERSWIAKGIDVDQAFAAKYYDSLDGAIAEAERQVAREVLLARFVHGAWIAGVVALLIGCAFAYRRLRARRRPA